MPIEQAVKRTAELADQMVVPRHIGVTMDGNGRWAQSHGLPRTEGHRRGIDALKRLVRYAIQYGVEYLTVYSFSSENWRRPKDEIEFIFKLLHRFVESDLQELATHNVRVRILGERQGLDKSLLATIERAEARTSANTGLNLNVAFNYGGKAEIAAAAKLIAQKVRDGLLDAEAIDENLISDHLYTGGMPEPDLLIRTGGDQRISNFLIWQSAYAELVFLKTAWPDFEEADFIDALTTFSQRERRFGGLGSEVS